MLGMHGTYAANMAVAESDLLIAVGCASTTVSLENSRPSRRMRGLSTSISIRQTWARIVAPEISLVADAREALSALQTEIKKAGQL